jgi:hypothetical protein
MIFNTFLFENSILDLFYGLAKMGAGCALKRIVVS